MCPQKAEEYILISQISIYAENKKGAMSTITGLLAEAGININAFVTNDSAEFGTVRMLVSDADKASALLSEAGYLTRRTSVLAVEISDEPGSLDRLLRSIERANINIDYLYATYDRDSAGPIIVIHADDMPELEASLGSLGYAARRG